MSTLYPYKGYFPLVDPNTFLAPGARVIGDVTLAEGVSIWYNGATSTTSPSASGATSRTTPPYMPTAGAAA